MPRILAVNNYHTTSAFSELRQSLVSAGATVAEVGPAEASAKKFAENDAVVLSGSRAMLSEPETSRKFDKEESAVRDSAVPILGVCFGHQLIGQAFGSRVVRSARPTKRYVVTQVLAKDALFANLPMRISVFESHYENVDSVPPGFKLIAKSATSPVCAIKNEKRSIYGIQFHPERNSRLNPDGRSVVANFVRQVR